MEGSKHYCYKCEVNEIPEPEYCCNGHMCGCEGYPIEPPLCEECFEKWTGWEFVEESDHGEFT